MTIHQEPSTKSDIIQNFSNGTLLGQATFAVLHTISRLTTRKQVFTPASAALFVVTGIGLFYYFRYEKAKLLEERGTSYMA